MTGRHQTRRDFLRTTTGVVAAAPWMGPALARAAGSNELLQVASIGVGGMIGRHDLTNITGSPRVRLVALCDVDANFLGEAAAVYPDAKTFRDFRRMFDAMADDIDAVVVSTPDHISMSTARSR